MEEPRDITQIGDKELLAIIEQSKSDRETLKKKKEAISARIEYIKHRAPKKSRSKIKGLIRDLDKLKENWIVHEAIHEGLIEECRRRTFQFSDWWISNTEKYKKEQEQNERQIEKERKRLINEGNKISRRKRKGAKNAYSRV